MLCLALRSFLWASLLAPFITGQPQAASAGAVAAFAPAEAAPGTFCTAARLGDFTLDAQMPAAAGVELLIRANRDLPTDAFTATRIALPAANHKSQLHVQAAMDLVKVMIDGAVVDERRVPTAMAGFFCVVSPGARQLPLHNARIKDEGKRTWVSLFNGKSLDGLAALQGKWDVKDGALVGRPDVAKGWGALRADVSGEQAVVKVVYRLRNANGGLYPRAIPKADVPTAVVGVQADLDVDNTRNGALFETGGRGLIAASNKGAGVKEGWNEAIVSAHEGRVFSFVNGVPVADTKDDTCGTPGVPAIEVFGHDDALIEIKEFAALSEPLAPALPGVTLGLCTSLKGDVLKQTRDVGFDYAEVAATEVAAMSQSEFAAAVQKVKALGLPVLSAIIFLPSEMKVAGPDANPDAQNAYLDKLLPRLSQLGLKMVVFGSGRSRRVPDGFSKEEAFKQVVDFARRAAERAKANRMLVVVESLRSEETNMINTAAEALALVKAVNHPNFKMLVDYYHMAMMKEDFAIIVKAGTKNIVHVQMANPQGRFYPQSDNESGYATFFERLRQIGYKGGVSIEAKAENPTADGHRALVYLRRATSVLSGKAAPR